MKPKFICDRCWGGLKGKMDEGDESYIIPNNINEFNTTTHHNCPNYVVLCEECYEEKRDELKELEDWSALQEWDESDIKNYIDFDKLKEYILKLSKEE